MLRQYQFITLILKRITFSIILLFGILDHSYGQEFRFGITYSTELSENSDEYVNYDYLTHLRNYNLGLSVERVWKNNFSLNSGIYYSQYKFNVIPEVLFDSLWNYNCSDCNYYVPPDEQIKSYLEIPITARYYIFNNKFLTFVEAGVINNILIESTYLNEKDYYLNGVVSLGVGISILQNWYLESSLNYLSQISTIYEDNGYKQKLIRLNFGLKRGF